MEVVEVVFGEKMMGVRIPELPESRGTVISLLPRGRLRSEVKAVLAGIYPVCLGMGVTVVVHSRSPNPSISGSATFIPVPQLQKGKIVISWTVPAWYGVGP